MPIRILFLSLAALLAACSSSPYPEMTTLGEDSEILGPNITKEIEAGEFFLGPRDKINLDVYGHPGLSRSYSVSLDGTAYFHLIGKQEVTGLDRGGLQERLTQEYARLIVDPSVVVTVEGSTLRKVTILGEISRPGIYPLTHPRVTILDAVALAGGLDATGDRTGILVARSVNGTNQVRAYSLDMLFSPVEADVPTEIPFVQPGDYVYVLKSPEAEFDDRLTRVRDVLRTALIGVRLFNGADELLVTVGV